MEFNRREWGESRLKHKASSVADETLEVVERWVHRGIE